jgi:hypothetical protein
VEDGPENKADPSGLWSVTFGYGLLGVVPFNDITGFPAVGGGVDGGIVIGNGGIGVSWDAFGGAGVGAGLAAGPGVSISLAPQSGGYSTSPMEGVTGFVGEGEGGSLSVWTDPSAHPWYKPLTPGGWRDVRGLKIRGGGAVGGGVIAGGGIQGSAVIPWRTLLRPFRRPSAPPVTIPIPRMAAAGTGPC